LKINRHGLGAVPAACRKKRLFLKACRAALGPARKRAGELNVILTTNPGIRKINKRFLNHDRNTDVIAFPYKVPAAGVLRRGGAPPFGDVYVSADQARIQAGYLGHSLLEELLTLAIHGTLHLMGYDDHRPSDRRRMFSRQDRILSRLKLQ